jgi:N utilization substance protein A
MEDIGSLISVISEERNIKKERVEEAIKSAFIHTAKKIINRRARYEVELDGERPVIYEILYVSNRRKHDDNSILLDVAQKRYQDYQEDEIKIGDVIKIPHDLTDFGRNASAQLFVNIENKIEEFKEKELYFHYKEKLGELVRGRVISVDENEDTMIELLDETQGMLTRRNRIKGEKFRVGDLVVSVIKYVNIDEHKRVVLDLSRTSVKFLNALFKQSVPEIADGVITIHRTSRIPGDRAKIAVSSENRTIDPVSIVVGGKGVKIASVSKESNGEIIDCVNHSEIPEIFIKNSLSPAEVENVKIDKEGVAFATLKLEERGKAIGKSGVNLKLAQMLTGYDIKLITLDKNGVETLSTDVTKQNRGVSAESRLGALFSD